jgi:predicted site-specific integrase-resolvase
MTLDQNKITYQSANKIKEMYDVSTETLRRWADSGRISIVRTPGGKRLYSISDIRGIFGDNQTRPTQKAKICYARVSSEHQRGDLERQIANLRQHYPEYEIVSDIGSGLNWKRRGFVALLERIHAGGIEEVVVTRKV